MVVQIINGECAVFVKPKNHPPVCADRHGPNPLHLALQGMQPEAGDVEIGGSPSSIQSSENVAQLVGVFRNHAALIVVFVEAFQPLMTNRLDHFIP